MSLTKATHYRAYAAASLANAEQTPDKTKRAVHFAIARHFYGLAEDEIGRVNAPPIESGINRQSA
jgi:hypothetical protein